MVCRVFLGVFEAGFGPGSESFSIKYMTLEALLTCALSSSPVHVCVIQTWVLSFV